MVKGVFFDMGGTLEDLYSDAKNVEATGIKFNEILKKHNIKVDMDGRELWTKVCANVLAYKDEAEHTLYEHKPEQIWADYGFRGIEVDREAVAACSEEIAHMWEITYFDRKLRDHVPEMMKGLKELGLFVGIISNTASVFQVYDILKEYGIRDYVDGIVLSSVVNYRKPHPKIFKIALCDAGLEAKDCAFVGDTYSRDVVGPRRVGFGKVFWISSFLTPLKDKGSYDVQPDHKITDIYEVYTILRDELKGK